MKIRNVIIITDAASEIHMTLDEQANFTGNIVFSRDSLPPDLVLALDCGLGRSKPQSREELERRIAAAKFAQTENHEQRIAALEAERQHLYDDRKADLTVAVDNWRGLFIELDKRIAALESEFKDFGAWALEILGPIGPPGGGNGIIARISKLEADRLQADYRVVVDETEKRITALEQERAILRDALLNKAAMNDRIAALEEKSPIPFLGRNTMKED